MAQDEKTDTGPPSRDDKAKGSPPRFREDLPSIFSDGVWSAYLSDSVMKFYLARFDHGPSADPTAFPNITTQIVMPIGGFVAATVFLEAQARYIVSSGLFPQEEYDRIRNNFFGSSDEKSEQQT